jgi:hypothetical protein
MRKKIIKTPEIKNTGGIGIVNLATYTSPKIVEIKTQDWISYGEDNNYFGYLQDRINGSPTNNAIVNGISQMIFGKGIDASDKALKPEDYLQTMLLFDDDTTQRLCNDLKAMGNCAIQIVYSIDRSRIIECNHFPVETLRSGKCNEDGEVEQYFYSDDWTKVNRQKAPMQIPAFGYGNSNEEILYVKPYKTGFYYYAPVDYQGGLQYCELEEEISNYHLNNIMNGLAPSMLINFNNGTPTEDEQRQIERDIQAKFSGTSNAGRFILSFNDSNNYGATITPVQLSDAHNQYQFLSDESMRKIMVSHRVISPMLLGIKDNSGFGNNADELQTATVLMDNTVIRPFQNLLIKEFNKILAYNEISLKLYFKTLQPLDANNELTITEKSNSIIDSINSLSPLVANKVLESMSSEEIRALVGLKAPMVSTQPTEIANPNLSEQEGVYDLESFNGESIDADWELVDKREYSNENSTIESWAKKFIKPKKGFKLKDYITSRPSAESYLDEGIYKVRYEYSQKYSRGNSREFCVTMMNRTSNGVVYRKEDIDQASFQGVNNSFGHEGQNYSLFEFKGGVNCGHYWSENLYRLKSKTDGTPYDDKALSSSEQVDSIAGYNPSPSGWSNAQTAPADMPDEGHHPDWVAKHRN